MATYTNNNNTVALQDLKGPQGSGGSTGPAGVIGTQGNPGLQGPIGSPNYLRTDIEFSGQTGPGIVITEGGLKYIGSCIFSRQKQLVDSASTEVKVTIKALTQGAASTEIGLVLNCNRPATNGNTILASTTASVSGNGIEKDITIVPLTVTTNTFINTGDVLSLWAYIKPTHENQTQTIGYLEDSGNYTNDQIVGYKDFYYEYPYRITTENLWLLWLDNYNIKNDVISPTTQTDFLQNQLDEQTVFGNIVGGIPQIDVQSYGKLNVYYLQIK